LGGKDGAVTAADNFRRLRRAGVTRRKTIDMIIGTYCIVNGLELFHADRDFDVLRQKLGLRVVTP
jgi:predicted nucleic acid-binding protein